MKWETVLFVRKYNFVVVGFIIFPSQKLTETLFPLKRSFSCNWTLIRKTSKRVIENHIWFWCNAATWLISWLIILKLTTFTTNFATIYVTHIIKWPLLRVDTNSGRNIFNNVFYFQTVTSWFSNFYYTLPSMFLTLLRSSGTFDHSFNSISMEMC